MAENVAPDIETFCAESSVPDSLPTIRFIGGISLEAQVDPTSGVPGTCALTLDLIGNLQAMLAPFQPFLTLLDLVAGIAQCFLLLTEVVTNPFKIPDLLACLPGLVEKINKILSLIPVFPQGIQAFITFVVDIIRFVGQQIDCVVGILESIQEQINQLQSIADKINNTDDALIVADLQVLFDCAKEEADRQSSVAFSALGPIARILCTVRAILALTPGGLQIAKALAFPNPDTGTVQDAIDALSLVRDALLGFAGVITDIAAPFGGVLAPPEIGFKCPLDDLPDEEPEEEVVPIPTITDPGGITEPGGAPIIDPSAPETDAKPIQINGTNFTATSQVFFGTAPLGGVQFSSPVVLLVTIPTDVLQNSGEFLVSVVNAPTEPQAAFAGLSAPGEAADTPVEVSNLLAFTVA